MTRVAIPEVRIPEPWALGGSLGSRDSPSEGDLRVTCCTLQPVLPLCSPLRSSGPNLMLPVMRSFLARGSPWYPGQWDLQFLLCRLAGPKPIPGETTGPVQGAVPGVAEAWAGEAGGARLGKAGCWLGVWTLHAPFPSYPSRPAPQDPRRGGTQLHGPTCAGRWRLQHSLVYSSSSFSGLEPGCPSRARGLGTSGEVGGWKEEEGPLTGVWLRKGIGPGFEAILEPCLTATFLSIPALTCGQVSELQPEPPGSHGP